jgi:hypothetical protein
VSLSTARNIQQSLKDYVKTYLDSVGYSTKYEMRDAYPSDRNSPLDKTIIVCSLDGAGPARNIEIGGPLTSKTYVFMFDVLGADERYGMNIATLIAEKLEDGENVPLYDYSTSVPVQFDEMHEPRTVTYSRVNFASPEPWQQFWHLASATYLYEYNRSFLA